MPLFGKPKGERVTLRVEGMSCGHCEMRVKQALMQVEGVQNAQVDHVDGVAIVTLSPQVGSLSPALQAQLESAVEEVGYRASL